MFHPKIWLKSWLNGGRKKAVQNPQKKGEKKKRKPNEKKLKTHQANP
jgi:hypothetical protein